jgi:hypothetical protein
LWQVAIVPTQEAEAEDRRFGAQELTPEERVKAVHPHGRPRATKDLDVFIDLTKTNATRVVQAKEES